MSPTVMQQLTSLFAGLKQEMHVTDSGGVTGRSSQGLGAAIVAVRFRLSHATRLQVENNRTAFMGSILHGVSLTARRVLQQGPATIGGYQASQIEFIQGSGATRLHQRIYVDLSSDAKRMFVVYFISPQRAWSQFLPSFTSAASSMKFSPSP